MTSFPFFLFFSTAGTQLVALGPVTTGSSHITVGVGVVEPTMVMGEEQGATGIQAVILVAMLPRIGGTSWCKVLTTSCCFFFICCYRNLPHLFCVRWNKLNLGLLHWQYLASNKASLSDWWNVVEEDWWRFSVAVAYCVDQHCYRSGNWGRPLAARSEHMEKCSVIRCWTLNCSWFLRNSLRSTMEKVSWLVQFVQTAAYKHAIYLLLLWLLFSK